MLFRSVKSVRKPVVSRNPEDVFYLNARVGGVFLPKVSHGAKLKKGELIGYILDPLNGKILDNVEAEEEGMLFTIREYPIVLEGSLMGRILKKEVWGCE